MGSSPTPAVGQVMAAGALAVFQLVLIAALVKWLMRNVCGRVAQSVAQVHYNAIEAFKVLLSEFIQ